VFEQRQGLSQGTHLGLVSDFLFLQLLGALLNLLFRRSQFGLPGFLGRREVLVRFFHLCLQVGALQPPGFFAAFELRAIGLAPGAMEDTVSSVVRIFRVVCSMRVSSMLDSSSN
jgi:hypothetical protein